MTTQDADRIVKEVLDGQVEAYGALIDTHQADVWRIAAAALRDRESTADLVQQIFVEAYFSLERYRRGTDFRAWLRGIARNQVREHLRKHSRHARLLETYRGQLEERTRGDSDGDLDPALESAHRKCRELLPEPSAKLLSLRYEHDLSHHDIAARLGRSMEAVKQLLYRVHILLRDCIEKRMAQA
jgi:RNA polymerase sigma-70 factor (ECF subfamily)